MSTEVLGLEVKVYNIYKHIYIQTVKIHFMQIGPLY